MNLTRVLDVDGSGVIDPGVLERSLRQFDGNVFTEETVQELLSDVGEQARRDGFIVIQEFASLVTAPYPIACSASSLDSHVDGAIADVAAARAAEAEKRAGAGSSRKRHASLCPS